MNLTLIAFALLLISSSATAQSIEFQAEFLGDISPGVQQWQYTYFVNGYSFGSGDGFSVQFDAPEFGPISGPLSAGSAWDSLVFQTDPLIPAEGLYDAVANSDGAATDTPFSVTFEWTGAAPPGAQSYQVFDENFATLSTGTTVPEPSLSLLVAAGCVGLGYLRTFERRFRA